MNHVPRHLDESDFFRWAQGRSGRYELLDGVVMTRAGATRSHERVAKRVFALLYAQVDEAKFDVNKGDFGVRIAAGRGKDTILYPDVVVDLQSGGASERATQTPVVVVEVLSESTDFDDHVEKFGRYARRPELRVYLVFAQQEARAWVWRRALDGTWPASPAEVAANGAIDLPEIGARLALADIYR